jgi:hypothetical protein
VRRFRALCPLVLLAASGCVGAVVGTVIDSAVATARRPVAEYLFFGAYKYDNPRAEPLPAVFCGTATAVRMLVPLRVALCAKARRHRFQ